MTATRETLREATPTPETADIAGLVERQAFDLVDSIVSDQLAVRADTNLTDAWYSVTEDNAAEIMAFARKYAATALQALSAELAEAKRERDAYKLEAEYESGEPEASGYVKRAMEKCIAAQARATTAEAEARAMREALEEIAATDLVARYRGMGSEPDRYEVGPCALIARRALGGSNAE